jgi:hypothetical protein
MKIKKRNMKAALAAYISQSYAWLNAACAKIYQFGVYSPRLVESKGVNNDIRLFVGLLKVGYGPQ